MDDEQFTALYKNLQHNIAEIKEMIKKPKELEIPKNQKLLEKLRYLFYSLTKSTVDIGHSIILENEYRDPLNRTDIFISLAERDIILSSVVPGVKKATLALPKLNSYPISELLAIVSASLPDIHKCLDSFQVYFRFKDKKL
jgi:uncharacterized protein YutE (UPF0331/DUF86 family)